MRHFSRIASIFFLCITVAGGANAASITPGSFTADAVEDYEATPGGNANLTSLFGGTVSVMPSSNDHRSVDAGDWTDFRTGGAIVPSSGNRFGTIFGFSGFQLDFTGLGGIFGFGGFASAAGQGNDVIEFFDLGGNLVDTFTETGGFGPGNGTMVEFSFVSDMAIGLIRLSGPETAFDDLAIATSSTQPIPLPAGIILLLTGLGALGLARRRASA
ncbi:MAG: VPLPA-CTERM sorting domain-containing protein [Roseovarius sp.]|jgi:hypothetical protein|uniref:VPLPA-CTERM sorting domain-containing protein n=1 Tax=Roseovarius sp. TaxID=1486281 RepID=UPI0032EDDF49